MERKITIEEEELYQEDYQIRMLKINHPEGLLEIGGRGMNGKSYYDYNVSGKISVKAMYERGKIGNGDIKEFLVQFRSVLRTVEKYLLNIHCILLDPEYIFYEEDHFYFCYYPPARQDIWEAFHELTEYLVRQADYQDPECVRIVFLLHKETMEENYSLDKIISECLRNSEEELGRNLRKETLEEVMNEPMEQRTAYDTREHDWITEQEMGSSILKETENLWTPVKRFLNRHKKSKWGDWDGLYIEEEEL